MVQRFLQVARGGQIGAHRGQTELTEVRRSSQRSDGAHRGLTRGQREPTEVGEMSEGALQRSDEGHRG